MVWYDNNFVQPQSFCICNRNTTFIVVITVIGLCATIYMSWFNGRIRTCTTAPLHLGRSVKLGECENCTVAPPSVNATVIPMGAVGKKREPDKVRTVRKRIKTWAPCTREDCPCTASWNGLEGEYCCLTCRDGEACAHNYHRIPFVQSA